MPGAERFPGGDRGGDQFDRAGPVVGVLMSRHQRGGGDDLTGGEPVDGVEAGGPPPGVGGHVVAEPADGFGGGSGQRGDGCLRWIGHDPGPFAGPAGCGHDRGAVRGVRADRRVGQPGLEDWSRCPSVGECRDGVRRRAGSLSCAGAFPVGGLLVAVGLQPGVVGAQGGVVGAELVGVLFQVEDLADAGEVDPVGDQFGDPAEPAQVVLAVPAGAAGGAGRRRAARAARTAATSGRSPRPAPRPPRWCTRRRRGPVRSSRSALHPRRSAAIGR